MKFDIIIVGGGMVGAALACALRASKLRIALIDATMVSQPDPRLIALNYSSCEFFKKLGIWSQLEKFAAPIHEVHVSYQKRFGSTRITAEELNLQALGAVVPAKHINAALYQNLSHIELFRPATLKNFTQQEDSIFVETDNATLECHLLIGADGTRSTVRQILNIETEITDHQQSAIVTITELQRSHYNVAYERFHPTGAIAMLPLKSDHAHQVATIWSDNNENITQLLQLSDEEFLQQLQKQFGYRLGRLKAIGKRFVFPLQTILAKQQAHQNVLLIGNAAHTLHPIAAQGLNLALHEVAAIAENLSRDPTLSASQLLPNNSQQRASIRLSHHLPRLFTHDFFALATARQLGLIGLDVFAGIKRRFARQALGNPFLN